MHVLWAPWRMAYIGGPKTPGCIFCQALETVDRRGHLVLSRQPAVVMLNKYPYSNGHLLVAPRRHAAHLGELPPDDFHTLMDTLQRTATVLSAAVRAEGLNLGMNMGAAAGAGVADHLHWHIVPRWVGDTNFMPTLADVRVIPEHLEAMYDRLEPLFTSGDS
jgi:ATP adenylyltransferase